MGFEGRRGLVESLEKIQQEGEQRSWGGILLNGNEAPGVGRRIVPRG